MTISETARSVWYHAKAVLLSILGFIVVSIILAIREKDDCDFLDGGDDDSDSVA